MNLTVFDAGQRAVFNRVRFDDDSAIHNLVSIEDFLQIYVPALGSQGIHPTRCIEKCFKLLLAFPNSENDSTKVWESLFFYYTHVASLLNMLVCAYPKQGFGMHKEIHESMSTIGMHIPDFRVSLQEGVYTMIQAIIYPHLDISEQYAVTFNILEKEEDTYELYEMMKFYHGYNGPFLRRGGYDKSPFCMNTVNHCIVLRDYVIDNMEHYKKVGYCKGADVHTLLEETGGMECLQQSRRRSDIVKHLVTVGFDQAAAGDAFDAAMSVGQSLEEVARLVWEYLCAPRVDSLELPAEFLEC